MINLNDAPNEMLFIFFRHYPNLSDNFPKDIQNSFPLEIYLRQDDSIIKYAIQLHRLLFTSEKENENQLIWQILQTYRIINAAISSEHSSLRSLRGRLKSYRSFLENNEPLKTTLKKIESAKESDKPALICTGYSGWINDEGFVKFSDETNVFIYAGIGGKLSGELAWDIENLVYSDDDVIIKNLWSNNTFEPNFSSIRKFNKNSEDALPNFAFEANYDLKTRVIESITGRILIEISRQDRNESLYLNEIIKKFLNRTIHFAGCLGLYDAKTREKFGPYLGYKWQKRKINFLKFETSTCSNLGIFSEAQIKKARIINEKQELSLSKNKNVM